MISWAWNRTKFTFSLASMTALLVSIGLNGCSDAASKLREGKYAPSSTHASVTSAEATVIYTNFAAPGVRDETKSAINTILAQHPGKPVILVQIRISADEQLWKSLQAINPGLSRFAEEDYYGVVDGVRVTPTVPEGITEVIDGNDFVRQDVIFQADGHVKNLDVLVKGLSLAKFAF